MSATSAEDADAQQLLALLPKTGAQAEASSLAISRLVLQALPPVDFQAWELAVKAAGEKAAGRARREPPPQGGASAQRFQDVATGMRLRYREWGDDDRTVIILHDTVRRELELGGVGTRLGEGGGAREARGHIPAPSQCAAVRLLLTRARTWTPSAASVPS